MVDVPLSHMTLLIVTIAFTAVNLCLIIATGGIIFNWQDRFMGPVLKCEQPKWNSDGRTQPNKIAMPWNTWNNANLNNVLGHVDAANLNNVIGNVLGHASTWAAGPDVSLLSTAWNNWNTGNGNAYGQVNTAWAAPDASINVQGSNLAGMVHTLANQYVPTYNLDGSLHADQFQMGNGAQWSSWKGNAWSTCPVIQFTRWSTWTQPQRQQWTQWTQTAWGTWTQPTAWVGTGNVNTNFDQAAWMAWAQATGQSWTNQANAAGQAWANNVWSNW